MIADEELIAQLRQDAGDYAIHMRDTPMSYELSWDARNVRAWEAADRLAALTTLQRGDARERIVEAITGGTITVPGGYGNLERDDAENIADAAIAAFPMLSCDEFTDITPPGTGAGIEDAEIIEEGDNEWPPPSRPPMCVSYSPTSRAKTRGAPPSPASPRRWVNP